MSTIKNGPSVSSTEIAVSESVFPLKTGNGCPLPHFLSVAKVTIRSSDNVAANGRRSSSPIAAEGRFAKRPSAAMSEEKPLLFAGY